MRQKKRLLSLVQQMPHTITHTQVHSTKFPWCFPLCACVWQGPWHRSGLRRLRDSSNSTVRAFLAHRQRHSTYHCMEKQQRKRKRRKWQKKTKQTPSALVQVGWPRQWRGEGRHLSSIKLCKAGMGESGRLRSDRAGSDDHHSGRQTVGPDEMSAFVSPWWPRCSQPPVNILCHFHVNLFYLLLLPAKNVWSVISLTDFHVRRPLSHYDVVPIHIHSTSPAMIAALCWLALHCD